MLLEVCKVSDTKVVKPLVVSNFFYSGWSRLPPNITGYMPCGVGHITKNSTNVFSACRKRRLKETGRGDWESPPL